MASVEFSPRISTHKVLHLLTHSLRSLFSFSAMPLQVNMKKHVLNIYISCLAHSRGFVEVGVCRFSNNKAQKKSVLADFKDAVAEFNSEFEDNRQKVSALFIYNTQHSKIDLD